MEAGLDVEECFRLSWAGVESGAFRARREKDEEE